MRTEFRTAATLAALLFLVAGASAKDEITVRFEPGQAGSNLAPRYSPKGLKVALTPRAAGGLEGTDHREGRLRLGPAATRGNGRLLVLARSKPREAFDLLWVDLDGDGSLEDETVQAVKPRLSRGSTYTSFKADLRIDHGSAEHPAPESYRIGLWVAVDDVVEPPPFIRYSRRGFLVGSVTIDGVAHHVVLSDADNDAVFGRGDWWALLRAEEGVVHGIDAARRVGDFAWSGKRAFKLELTGTAGREGRLVPFDPGLTPAEDARKRDPYWDDKHAERAAAPVAFERDVAKGIVAAREQHAPFYLDFETTWCGPCKAMDRWVYSAADVVAAAHDIVCIKVDGDEHKDMKELLAVGGFPTGILFDADGKEIARFSGYRTAAQMVAFFDKAREGSSPAADR